MIIIFVGFVTCNFLCSFPWFVCSNVFLPIYYWYHAMCVLKNKGISKILIVMLLLLFTHTKKHTTKKDYHIYSLLTTKWPYILCTSLFSHPWWCLASLWKLISGPLNTEGSFISFHVCRSLVLPSYSDSKNLDSHHFLTSGSVKSGHADDP